MTTRNRAAAIRPFRRDLARRDRAPRVVAVTGVHGFLGRNLVGLLEEDETVPRIVALDVVPPKTVGSKTHYYKLDLTQPSVDARLTEILAAEQVHTVVHLAFLSSPSTSPAWSHELESVGTMHVLNACRERRIAKFVLGSSTLLYGAHASNPNFLTESHPLRGLPSCPFLADKIDAERETRRFADSAADTLVTVLRFAPILGPTVRNVVSGWLSRRLVPTVLGFDPLLQFVHELDAVAALAVALDRDVPGVFNIVGDGVLPVSTVVKLAGRFSLPLPTIVARQAAAILFAANLAGAPAAFVQFLRFLCVADGARARAELGFRAASTTREAVLDFEGALRLREARLLQEAIT